MVPYRPPGKEGEKLTRIELTVDDGEALRRLATEIDDLSPWTQRPARLKKGDESVLVETIGATRANFQDIRDFYVDRGRFFSRVDENRRARVCVIGDEIIAKLKLKGDPLGQTIQIGNQDFEIIGVMEKKGKVFSESFDEFVLIPITTGAAIWGEDILKQVLLFVRARSSERIEPAMDQITEILRRRHKLRPDQPDDFRVQSQAGVLKVVKNLTNGLAIGAAVIVGFALLVASIGVTNIMLVSVTERTREIGIRKAIGAKSQNILAQFLIEAVTLCCVGGALGILAGLGMGMVGHAILNHFVPGWPDISIPVYIFFLGFLIPAVFGVIAGIWPAYKAAQLDPIDALRYE